MLIRAKDFIAHARLLRKPARSSGIDVSRFHKDKETYAKFFDEYFQATRDRMSGHLQDLDFVKRIELWNDVESGKLSFFVEAAQELYEHALGPNVPGYVPLGDMRTSVQELTRLLGAPLPSSVDPRVATYASDALAYTRPNTTGILNFTPQHQRASQLSLARMWIRDGFSLLRRLRKCDRHREHNAVLSRLLTDVVSFADCLVTNPAAGARSNLTGLRELLLKDSPTTSLDAFLAAVRFEELRSSLRTKRNAVGGHYEESPTVSRQDLDLVFSSIDIAHLEAYAGAMVRAFSQVCRDVGYLIPYAEGPGILTGVTADTQGEYIKPFAQGTPKAPASVQNSNDRQSARDALEKWIECTSEAEETEREIARGQLWAELTHVTTTQLPDVWP